MASKLSAVLLLLALFGVVLFLQVAVADELTSAGDVITASTNAVVDSNMAPADVDEGSDDEVGDVRDDQFVADQGGDETPEDGETETEEIQPYVYEADRVEAISESANDELDELQSEASTPVAAHPLARILHERGSKKCMWSSRKCKKLYKQAGCCRKKCVNLSTSNSHCGKCNKCCDTKRGYSCRSGKCRKRTRSSTCMTSQKCKGENTCCKNKCVNLEHDCKNCGKCGHQCPWGSACCNGQCKYLKSDCKNCGKCGRRCGKGKVCCDGRCICVKKSSGHCGACGKACGWGRKCCNGKCVSVASDKHNCGRCGRKCEKKAKCVYGICGYGHG